MRPLAMLAHIGAAAVAIVVAVWWTNRLAMRLMLRGIERRPPFKGGQLRACVPWIAAIAAGVCTLSVLVAILLHALLLPAPEWTKPVDGVWTGAIWIVLVLGVVAAFLGAFSQAVAAFGVLSRQRHLMAHPGTADAPSVEPVRGGRSIVVCCDGTGNRPEQEEEGSPATTNVWKIYRGLACDETQVTWYQAGVGSDTSTTARQARRTHRILDAVGAETGATVAATWSRVVQMVEGGFGVGVSEGVIRGYAEIVRQYRPGDRIYLVGFSRGAFTARCIAGVISRAGVLRAENIRYVPEVVQLYRMRETPADGLDLDPNLFHAGVRIEVLGVFDTVAALGVPLWGWWFRVFPIWKNAPFATDPARSCRFVYHALAMDERRSQFFPTLFDPPGDEADTRLEQRWFRGAHADVGGGYAATGLSDIALGWMMDALERHGLRFRQDARADMRPDPLARVHDELSRNPSWKLFGSWPRWHPVPGGETGPHATRLHESVAERAEKIQTRLGRPDMRRLLPGERTEFVTEAHREWDRTGFVVEQGATYRLTYLGGQWRDAETPVSGPAGRRPVGGDVRRFLGFMRRLPAAEWMCLIATVAHPRRWEVTERGWRELFRYFFVTDPKELTEQLAPIGRDLEKPGDAVLLRNETHGGLLHLFANDWWQTAGNNSGGIRLRIERLSAEDAATVTDPLWCLQVERGEDGKEKRTVWHPPGAR
ncbi:MAG: DUF2235 domain-containing protein [Alphaproteobacteria bacterium]